MLPVSEPLDNTFEASKNMFFYDRPWVCIPFFLKKKIEKIVNFKNVYLNKLTYLLD